MDGLFADEYSAHERIPRLLNTIVACLTQGCSIDGVMSLEIEQAL